MGTAKTRLDFMVLNHDDDLIGVTVREQLTAMQRRQQAAAKNAAIETILVPDVLPEEQQFLGKRDLRAVLGAQDLEAAILPK